MADNTIILNCKCKNEFQDKEYGKNRRVCNYMGKTRDKACCTVCSDKKVVYNTTRLSPEKEG